MYTVWKKHSSNSEAEASELLQCLDEVLLVTAVELWTTRRQITKRLITVRIYIVFISATLALSVFAFGTGPHKYVLSLSPFFSLILFHKTDADIVASFYSATRL